MALLKFIIIVAIIYFAFRFIGRVLLPILLSMLINKANKNTHQAWRNRQAQEGDVKLQGKKTKSRFSQDEGEYVDYEEIKD